MPCDSPQVHTFRKTALKRCLFLQGVAYGLFEGHRPALFGCLLPRPDVELPTDRGQLAVVERAVGGMRVRYDFYGFEDSRGGAPQSGRPVQAVLFGGDL